MPSRSKNPSLRLPLRETPVLGAFLSTFNMWPGCRLGNLFLLLRTRLGREGLSKR
jgi:hypothetical protein